MDQVIDPGHKYRLLTLDGELEQILTFVKRHDPENPERFPGNTESYPGTTLQSVIRALMDRVLYLNNQIQCRENELVYGHLNECLFLLEKRAARRHGLDSTNLTRAQARITKMCPTCGHVICPHRCPQCGSITDGGICQNYGCESARVRKS